MTNKQTAASFLLEEFGCLFNGPSVSVTLLDQKAAAFLADKKKISDKNHAQIRAIVADLVQPFIDRLEKRVTAFKAFI